MTRRRRPRRLLAGGVALVLLVGGGIGAYLLTAGAGRAPAAQPLTTARVTRGDLTQTVDATFALVRDPATSLASPAAGVITKLYLRDGARLRNLHAVVQVNGTTIYGIQSATPLYRSLAAGDEGADVKALQLALKAAGHDPGETDGTFGTATRDALEAWQAARGLDETGTLDLSRFVSYPPGATVVGVSAKLGDRAGSGTALATLGVPGGIVAQADVSQLDVGRLKPGQGAQLTFDALTGATAQATVASIPADPESQGQSAGSSEVVQYAVTLRPAKLPAGARAGMTGKVSVAVVSRKNVVLVPTSAIGGTAGAPVVQVVTGGGTETRPVLVGLSTPQGSEILTGVRPGEEVVTGIAPTGDSSQPADTDRRGGPGFGPGGVQVIR